METMTTRNETLAQALWQAEQTRVPIEPLRLLEPGLTAADAYSIQLINRDRALAEGQEISGLKIGLTSRAMQELLGIDEPDYGQLYQTMAIPDGGPLAMDGLIQPKVEGEIAFLLSADLTGPDVTAAEVMAATEWVMPAIEVVDSRIAQWRIGLVDTIADNGSSCRYVLGPDRARPGEVDLRAIRMTLSRNGEILHRGSGTDVMGDPAACVAWLANKLHDFGMGLKRGQIVLSGAFTAAPSAQCGDVFECDFDGLGKVSLRFE